MHNSTTKTFLVVISPTVVSLKAVADNGNGVSFAIGAGRDSVE